MQDRRQQQREAFPDAVIHERREVPSGSGMLVLEHRETNREVAYLHIHDCFEISLCRAGYGFFLIDDAIVAYGPGDALLLPPGMPHFARHVDAGRHSVAGESVWTSLFIEVERLWDDPSAAARLPAVVRLTEQPQIAQLLDVLIAEHAHRGPGWERASGHGLAWLGLALARLADGRAAMPHFAPDDPLVPALNTIGEHFREALSVESLARSCNMSASQLRRRFARVLGCSPQQYLHRLRIRCACEMLRSSREAIVAISMACGYESLSSFNRQFKQQLGCSPRVYRQRRRSA